LYVFVLKDEEEGFVNWVTELTNGQANITCIEKQFVEFSIS